jgi:shikimate kinase
MKFCGMPGIPSDRPDGNRAGDVAEIPSQEWMLQAVADVTRNSHTRQRKTASQRSVVLVTGMSGTGKSSALALLARHGHDTVDTDEPGWIIQSQTPDGPEPLWDLDRVGALLDRHQAGWLFIAGCVANQRELYHRFDAVVLLSAPIDILLERVTDRGNPFGSTSEDRAKIANDLAAYEPLLRAGADHEIVTTTPIAEVVSALEQIASTGHRTNR